MSKYGKATIDNIDIIVEEMEKAVENVNEYAKDARYRAFEAIRDICDGISLDDVSIREDWGNKYICVLIACLDGYEEIDGEKFDDWSIRRVRIS